MCGIYALLSDHPRPRAELERAVDAGLARIRHRGPDGHGTWFSPSECLGLGHVRLSIIDIEFGAQPMTSPCGRWTIAFNGEIYNYRELREELGASAFVTRSDTEVVWRAYARWGEGCLPRLRGMFAFVIWDNHEESLFLARDRFGIKPLYYGRGLGGLVVASELKGISPDLRRREIDPAALSDYLSFQFCLGDKTLLNGVSQLPAAHCAIVRRGGEVVPRRYWEVHYDIDYRHDEAWFVRRLRELLAESVRLHMRADVEVGAYLSGGIDSSLMASLACAEGSTHRLKSFNGRFAGLPEFDESAHAASVAAEHGMDLRVTDIGEMDFVDSIERVIWHLDQPVAGPGALPQFLVSRDVAQHVKVVLGGQGGDEIFGGYARYIIAYFEQCIQGAIDGTLHSGNFVVTYESIIPNLRTLQQYKPMLQEFWADGLFEPRDRRYWRLVNRANTMGGMLAPGVIDAERTFAEFARIYWAANVGKESYFDSMTHFDFKTLLPALLHVEDRMSMAHGIEARVPFLDHPLVEFAATIPADIKFKGGELKRLLRVAFERELPASVRARRDKMGFPVPLNQWIQRGGPARDMIADLLGSKCAQSRPYLRKGIDIDALLGAQGAFGRNLWGLISLELWQRAFID